MAIAKEAVVNLSAIMDELKSTIGDVDMMYSSLSDAFEDAFGDSSAQKVSRMAKFADSLRLGFSSATNAVDRFNVKLAVGLSLIRNMFGLLKMPMDLASSMIETTRQALGSSAEHSWNARMLGTNQRSYEALQDVDKAFGTGSVMTNALSALRTAAVSPDKQHSLLSMGLSNEDIDNFIKNKDSGRGLIDVLSKIRETGLAQGYDLNSRSYYEAVGGENLGLDFDEFRQLMKVLPEINSYYEKQVKLNYANEQEMNGLNKTITSFDRTMESVSRRFYVVLGPVIKTLGEAISDIASFASKELFNSDGVKAISDWIKSTAKAVKDWLKDDGMNKLRKLFKTFLEILGQIVLGLARMGNAISEKVVSKEQLAAMEEFLMTEEAKKLRNFKNEVFNTAGVGLKQTGADLYQLNYNNSQAFIDHLKAIGSETALQMARDIENQLANLRYMDGVSNNNKAIEVRIVGNNKIEISSVVKTGAGRSEVKSTATIDLLQNEALNGGR